MNFLTSILNVADRTTVVESNLELLDKSLAFMLRPSEVGGVPTTELGPPIGTDHLQDELWVDVLGAIWRCTVAGTPGTWIQIAPAVLLTADLPASALDNYLVKVADDSWKEKYWDAGGSAWVDVY